MVDDVQWSSAFQRIHNLPLHRLRRLHVFVVQYKKGMGIHGMFPFEEAFLGMKTFPLKQATVVLYCEPRRTEANMPTVVEQVEWCKKVEEALLEP